MRKEGSHQPKGGGKETEFNISFMVPFTLLRFTRYFFSLLEKCSGKQRRNFVYSIKLTTVCASGGIRVPVLMEFQREGKLIIILEGNYVINA